MSRWMGYCTQWHSLLPFQGAICSQEKRFSCRHSRRGSCSRRRLFLADCSCCRCWSADEQILQWKALCVAADRTSVRQNSCSASLRQWERLISSSIPKNSSCDLDSVLQLEHTTRLHSTPRFRTAWREDLDELLGSHKDERTRVKNSCASSCFPTKKSEQICGNRSIMELVGLQ